MVQQRSLAPVTDPPHAPVRIVLADHHQVVRRGLRLLLEDQRDIEVVAEADDLEGALRYVRGHHPAVLVLELGMPGVAPLDWIAPLRRQAPETQVVILTDRGDPELAREALCAGALAYVLKEADESELIEAVRRAAVGKSFLNPQLGARLAAGEPLTQHDDLTEREVDVLRRIARGHTNAEVAEQLSISVRTVETHRQHIQRKLRLSTRAELVQYAIDHRLMPSEPDHDVEGRHRIRPLFGVDGAHPTGVPRA